MTKITDPYLNRVISQHKVRPKFMAWLAALNGYVEDTMNLYRSFDEAFDLETAVGAQLDILGKIAGVDRLLNFQPVYSEPLLPDEYYRMIIKAKISLNHWDGTTEGILTLWDGIMGGYTLEVVDHQDMTMTLRIRNLTNLFESEFIARGYLAPKPETVGVNYQFVMRSDIEGEIFLGALVAADHITDWLQEVPTGNGESTTEMFAGGSVPADRIRDQLAPLMQDMENCSGFLHLAGALLHERVLEPLPVGFIAEDITIDYKGHCGGAIVSERITVYLEGGTDIGD